MPSSRGNFTYPKAITRIAVSDTTMKMVNWIQIRLVRCMSRPLVVVVGHDQRIGGGLGAGHLADGAPPLHLELGQVALPPGAGQEGGVQPAQGEVDDCGEVGVVAP